MQRTNQWQRKTYDVCTCIRAPTTRIVVEPPSLPLNPCPRSAEQRANTANLPISFPTFPVEDMTVSLNSTTWSDTKVTNAVRDLRYYMIGHLHYMWMIIPVPQLCWQWSGADARQFTYILDTTSNQQVALQCGMSSVSYVYIMYIKNILFRFSFPPSRPQIVMQKSKLSFMWGIID